MRVARPRLICFGNLTLDDTVLPDGTERPSCVGGDALYAALGARLWEPATEMVAPRGRDFSTAVADQIAHAGLSLAGLAVRPVPTIRNRVVYDRRGERQWTLYSSPADFHTLSPVPGDIPPSFLHAEAFLIAAMSLEAQEALIPWLRAHTQGVVALDLQEDYINGNEDRLCALIRLVDIFLPSEDEVRQLFGHEDWLVAARESTALGPRIAVIKRGAAGSLVYNRESRKVLEIPPFPGPVVDTTGAGDAYCGGFLARHLQNPRDLARAARAGAISASFAIAGFGTGPLFATRAEMAAERAVGWGDR